MIIYFKTSEKEKYLQIQVSFILYYELYVVIIKKKNSLILESRGSL